MILRRASPHQRHARPVDQVRRRGRVEDRDVGAGAGREPTDVVAAQGHGAADGRRCSASSIVILISRTASAMQNGIEVV